MWLLRGASIPVVAPAAYYFVYWWRPFVEQPDSAAIVATTAAVAVTGFVWLGLGDRSPGPIKAMLLGAFLVGSIGFDLGFFGPLLLSPEANQGPLLGLVITGPLGLVLGAIGGLWYWLIRISG